MFLKIKSLVSELGRVNAAFYVVHRVLKALTFNKCYLIQYLIVAQPVSEKPMLPPRRGAKINIKEVKQGNTIRGMFPVQEGVVKERYEQGARCLVATQDDVFIGYLWFVSKQYWEDEARLQYILPDNEEAVWDFDVYIEPEYRMGFGFMRLWDEAYSILREQGVRYSYSRISAYNRASLASHKRLGAKNLFSINCIVVGRIQITFTGKSPLIYISLRNKVPKIYLSAPDKD